MSPFLLKKQQGGCVITHDRKKVAKKEDPLHEKDACHFDI